MSDLSRGIRPMGLGRTDAAHHDRTSMTLNSQVSAKYLLALGATALVAALGCRGPKVERQHLQGSVTYKGQPLAAGQIRFSPTKREGMGGSLGGAVITNGKYDTGAERGLAAPIGEVQVLATGPPRTETSGPEAQTFPGYSTTLTVTSETKTFDVQVP